MYPYERYAGWPSHARALVDKAVARHGGWSRFHALHSLTLTLQELSGPLSFIKGLGRFMRRPLRVVIFPHEDRVDVLNYPAPGQQGIFTGPDVRIVTTGPDLREPQCVQESHAHRQNFAGWNKLRRWNRLDALYFFGYALRTYLTLPYLLSRLTFVAELTVRDLGEELFGVTVDFPSSYDTHCQRQTLFFDRSGLLRRHDYGADIVMSGGRGAHYSADYVEVGGIVVPTRRWVVARLGSYVTSVTVLYGRFGEFSAQSAFTHRDHEGGT